jgi:hypothetical protein
LVVEHLRRQEKAALLKLGGGAYRGLGGGSCPVGMLVDSNLYTTSMEGVPVRLWGIAARRIRRTWMWELLP